MVQSQNHKIRLQKYSEEITQPYHPITCLCQQIRASYCFNSVCVCAAFIYIVGCTHAQHTYTFFWSAEEIFLLHREKIFPLRSRKISSA